MGYTFELFLRNCEEYVLKTLSIEVARDETLPAESLDDSLVADLTDLAVQCEMFHLKINLKRVTQSAAGADPIAPKAYAL